MAIINIFTAKAPTVAGYSFDAVLEDTFEASVEVTTYPVETGVRIGDNRILNPFVWRLTGAVSNNPLKTQLTDFLGGALSNLTDNPIVAGVAGLSAGWLAGSEETRASSTLALLLDLMLAEEPFVVDAGDITLKNMVITRLSRTKEPRNENGLEFVAELQEIITLDRVAQGDEPSTEQLRTDDPSESAAARAVRRGQQIGQTVGAAVNSKVNEVLDGIF